MMRLQRVGRKNDASFRIVVTDKRTGPKSDKHVDRLGSYNPKLNQVQLDAAKAKDWLTKGVQPSDTVYNILVGQGVLEGKKKNVLPKKSPIIDEEALKRAEEEAKAKAEAEAAAAAAAAEPTVEVVADEDDPAEGGEIAEGAEELKKKEEAEHAEAQTDAEGD